MFSLIPGSSEVLSKIWRLNRPLQHLFRKAVQSPTQVFCPLAQGLPLCHSCLVTATKGCLGNLKSCLEERGLLNKKIHKGTGRAGRPSLNTQRTVVLLLMFIEPFLCAGHCARASHTQSYLILTSFQRGGYYRLYLIREGTRV